MEEYCYPRVVGLNNNEQAALLCVLLDFSSMFTSFLLGFNFFQGRAQLVYSSGNTVGTY